MASRHDQLDVFKAVLQCHNTTYHSMMRMQRYKEHEMYQEIKNCVHAALEC